MSTRAQVQVVHEGMGEWKQKITLYHHCDGYPEGILPLIEEAKRRYGNGWEGGRAGKVASFLCAVHPGEFEPEEGHELHGDIEYFYRLTLHNQSGGSMAETPKWTAEVFETKQGFWDKPTEENLKLIQVVSL